jgi:hypothetical protein
MLLDLRLFSFYSFINKDYFFTFERKYIILFSFLIFFLLFISIATNFNFIFALSELPGKLKYLNLYSDVISSFYSYSNIYVFGWTLYSLCFFPFLLTGVLLLIALIAAINITMSAQANLIAQTSYIQILRNSKINIL